MWLSFSFKVSPNQQDVLLALLDSVGFEGFEQNDEELIGFISQKKFSEVEFLEIIRPLSFSFEKREIVEENWNEQWEKSFQPIIIDNKIAVRASFHQPIKNVEHEIIIDPKMSFGTGHHATTEMMMRFMLDEYFRNKSVFDFGCGTAILSILASKMGTGKILAIDNDERSIENARENFGLNGISNFELTLMDSVPAGEKFDFILANVTRSVITQQLPNFYRALNDRGKLLISGFLGTEKSLMNSKAEQNGFTWFNDLNSGDWMAALLKRN